MSADADAEIDVNAPDFWEKVLPEDMNPDRMAMMIDSGEAYESIEKRRKFIEDLSAQVLEITSLRAQGITPVQETTITALLHRVARMTQSFDQNQRTQCFQWLTEIEHPRRRKSSTRMTDLSAATPTTVATSRKRRRINYTPHMPNSFGNRQFNRTERQLYEAALISIVSSSRRDNLWEDIQKQCGVVRRSFEELCGFGIVLMEVCATLCEGDEDIAVFRETKKYLILNLPKREPKRRGPHQPVVDPATCNTDTFPCFNDPQYTKHIQKRAKRWCRLLRLGKAVQNELIRYDKPQLELQLPDKCTNLPIWWWSHDELVYDKELILGVGKHGMCGWEKIKNDPKLIFSRKVEQASKLHKEKKNAMDTSSSNTPRVELKTNNITIHSSFAAHQHAESSGRDCICGKPDDQTFMIECEQCHKWCHGRCVHVDQANVPKVWFCPRCDLEWPSVKHLESRVKAIVDTIAEIRRYQEEEEEKKQIAELRDITRANRNREWSKRERSEFIGCLYMFGKRSAEETQQLGGLSRKSLDQIESYYENYITQCRYIIDKSDYEYQRKIFSDPKLSPRDRIARLRTRRPRPKNGPYRGVVRHCYCQQFAGKKAIIVCSNCQKWYHLECAGVERNVIPDKFQCRFCSEGTLFEKKRRKILSRSSAIKKPSGFRAACRNSMQKQSPLYESCELLLKQLFNHNYSDQFSTPVDPKVLGLNNYFDIVQHPMDLSTIKDNMIRGAYCCPEIFAEDVRLIFRNCRHYNESTAGIVAMADTLSKIFEEFYSRLVPRHQQLQGIEEMGYYALPLPTPPRELADEIITEKVARRVIEHVELHENIQRCWKLGAEIITTALGFAKNQCGSSAYSLPEWWSPPIHDLLILEATLKHGIGQGQRTMADSKFRKITTDDAQIKFFLEFLVDRKPLIRRIQYICHLILHPDEMYRPVVELTAKSYPRINYKLKGKRRREPSGPSTTTTTTTRKSRKKEIQRNANGQPILPIRTRGANVLSLGHIVIGPGIKAWHTPSYIWPEGFRSTRTYTSYTDPDVKVEYTSEIVSSGIGGGPCFKVTAIDDPNNPVIKETASGAWCAILEKINQKKTTKRNKVTVSGPEMFGYSDHTIKGLIEELPGTEACVKYWAKKQERQQN